MVLQSNNGYPQSYTAVSKPKQTGVIQLQLLRDLRGSATHTVSIRSSPDNGGIIGDQRR